MNVTKNAPCRHILDQWTQGGMVDVEGIAENWTKVNLHKSGYLDIVFLPCALFVKCPCTCAVHMTISQCFSPFPLWKILAFPALKLLRCFPNVPSTGEKILEKIFFGTNEKKWTGFTSSLVLLISSHLRLHVAKGLKLLGKITKTKTEQWYLVCGVGAEEKCAAGLVLSLILSNFF